MIIRQNNTNGCHYFSLQQGISTIIDVPFLIWDFISILPPKRAVLSRMVINPKPLDLSFKIKPHPLSSMLIFKRSLITRKTTFTLVALAFLTILVKASWTIRNTLMVSD